MSLCAVAPEIAVQDLHGMSADSVLDDGVARPVPQYGHSCTSRRPGPRGVQLVHVMRSLDVVEVVAEFSR